MTRTHRWIQCIQKEEKMGNTARGRCWCRLPVLGLQNMQLVSNLEDTHLHEHIVALLSHGNVVDAHLSKCMPTSKSLVSRPWMFNKVSQITLCIPLKCAERALSDQNTIPSQWYPRFRQNGIRGSASRWSFCFLTDVYIP